MNTFPSFYLKNVQALFVLLEVWQPECSVQPLGQTPPCFV